MANPSTLFMLYSMILALVVVASSSSSTTTTTTTTTTTMAALTKMSHSLDRWFKNLSQRKAALALTKLHIYIHADFNTNSDNQTVYQVAAAEITPNSSSGFGRILVIDNPFATGPDPGLQVVGHYQGTNAYSDFSEAAANMNMNIIFTGGDYNGSTISILGRQPVNEAVRVLSVIGGTGFFRFVRGIVLASTYSTDAATQTGIYEYMIYMVTPSVGPVQAA